MSLDRDKEVPRGRPYVTPSYLTAVGPLGPGALLAGPVAERMNIRADKRPLSLVLPLEKLNEGRLAPYRVVRRHVLEAAIVDALGTEEYIYWTLEDTDEEVNSPLRTASLFVTYYSGGRHIVPHRPDVCYLGAGYQPAQAHENMTMPVLTLPGDEPELPIRVCTFVKTALHDHAKSSVVYTFHANGRFHANALRVRVAVNAPATTHAYFSKTEVSFPGATRAQTIEGARKLFGVVLPILLQDHWPDYREAERNAQESSTNPTP